MFCRKMLKLCVLVFCLALCLAATAFAENVSEEDFFKLCMDGSPEEVEAAIGGGADVNARDQYGFTALMLAAWFNDDQQVVSLLLRNGADVHAKSDKGGSTALMRSAAGNVHPEITFVLLMAGADERFIRRDGLNLCSEGKPQRGCRPGFAGGGR